MAGKSQFKVGDLVQTQISRKKMAVINQDGLVECEWFNKDQILRRRFPEKLLVKVKDNKKKLSVSDFKPNDKVHHVSEPKKKLEVFDTSSDFVFCAWELENGETNWAKINPECLSKHQPLPYISPSVS